VSLSANGRFVVFRSAASNLVPNDTNRATDYFLRDLTKRSTTRISVSSDELQANGDSRQPVGVSQWTVSNDGRYVYFNSDASNLVPNDSNGAEDLFVRDTVLGTTRRVSVSSTGEEANSGVGNQDPSATFSNIGFFLVEPENGSQVSYSATPNGDYILFSSAATNLVPGDTNDTIDVFIRHVPSGTTKLLSVSSTGVQGNGPSNSPMISADARFAVFSSSATNLVSSDTNGFDDIFVSEISGGENLSGWY
jgi:archaellum component FlaF (FlaF/FlaG flagellin family)